VDASAFVAAAEAHWAGADQGTGLTVVVGPELLPVALRLADRGHATCAVPYDSVPLLLARRRARPGRGPRRLWDRLEQLRWSRLYRRALARLPVVVFVSPEDAGDAVRLGPPGSAGRVVVAPNGVDVERFQPGRERTDGPSVVFSGDLGVPQSREAVAVLREVLDEVWQVRPEVRVVLAGRRPGPAARAWAAADDRVTATGEVPELGPWIREAWVYLAPLVSGAGVKNRVLEALASGTPVVATPLAAAGLPGTPPLRVGDDVPALARHTLALLADAEARAAAGRDSRAYALRRLSWEGQVGRVLGACEAAWGCGGGP
jgi:glycosyltransferase involved in cell wall biosynthesis